MLDTKAIAAALAPIVKEHVATATTPLLKRIEELEAREPVAGKDGEPGRDGVDGKDADMDALKAHLESLVAALPKPQDGKDGRDGIDGKDGEPGEPGPAGIDGKDGADGVGLAGAMIGRGGDLVITLTNGEVKSLGPVVGRDGKDGKDGERGADGQAWTAMDVARTGPRTVELSFEHGDQRNTFEMEFPVPVYRGVFTSDEEYVEGDMVTFGGSLWHANETTKDKPGEGSRAWTLAAKRGRDGKDFAGPQAKAPDKVRI